jgi:hypothetical protein
MCQATVKQAHLSLLWRGKESAEKDVFEWKRKTHNKFVSKTMDQDEWHSIFIYKVRTTFIFQISCESESIKYAHVIGKRIIAKVAIY